MAQDLATNAKGAPEALTGSQAQLYKMGEFIGSKAVQDYSTRKGSYVPLQKVSSNFLHTLVLSQVNLRWDEKLPGLVLSGQNWPGERGQEGHQRPD